MIAMWEHLDCCDDCHRVFQGVFQSKRQGVPIRINLSPEYWFKDDHFDYETLAAFIDKTLDSEMREIADIHLKECSGCRGDLDSLITFRREIEPELIVRYGPEQQSSVTGWLSSLWNWPPVAWKPGYTFATLIIIGLAVVATVFLIKPRVGKKATAGDLIGLTPAPSIAASVSPSPNDSEKSIAQSPEIGSVPKPDSITSQTQSTPPHPLSDQKNKNRFRVPPPTEMVAMLNDSGRSISIDHSGNLTGINALSPELHQSIREFLMADEIKRPDILAEINGVNSSLRGMGEKPSFALLSPVGVVIVHDHPLFQWEPLNGATAYRVQVSDSPSREPISSDLLPATATQWTPTEALPRGKVYSWIVISIVNGKEIVSPLVSMPEAKFKVLEEEKARELNLVKRANSHLTLGVFYAREGMLAEAREAFQNLADDNPQSPIAKRLLGLIKSWQSPR
ncbi:MAG: zf-HC2 domain-containing protein [Acidobacteriota bacterium]